jgi:hypothetical protein
MMKQALPRRRRLIALGSAIALVCMIVGVSASPAAASQPGAIHLQHVGCTDGGEITHFDSKQDVYVTGSNLTPGTYSLVVTAPGNPGEEDHLLGQSPSANVTVDSNGDIACTQIWSVVNKASDGTQGFDDTVNNGGEYKVNLADATDDPKSKNFKAPGDACVENCEVSEQTLLHVRKFYDANTNGVHNLGEPKIAGWEVQATNVTDLFSDVTDWDILLDDGEWTVSENAAVEPNWFATTETSVLITIPPETTVDFGNVCIGAGGGLTLGFWSNKNGEKLFNVGTDLTLMDELNLVDAKGKAFDPKKYAEFRTWLLAATATNMAYMLSAQLAAMELNVLNGNVSGGALIYAPGTKSANKAGFATVNDVMKEANTELGLHPVAVSGNEWRGYQEALKNALDKANNSLTFVQGEPCHFSFPES